MIPTECDVYIPHTCILIHASLALIITEQRCFAGRKKKRGSASDGDQAGARSAELSHEPMEVVKKSVVSGIVTRIDLLEYISNTEHEE